MLQAQLITEELNGKSPYTAYPEIVLSVELWEAEKHAVRSEYPKSLFASLLASARHSQPARQIPR